MAFRRGVNSSWFFQRRSKAGSENDLHVTARRVRVSRSTLVKMSDKTSNIVKQGCIRRDFDSTVTVRGLATAWTDHVACSQMLASTAHGDTMHRVLSIPELLDLVFSYMDQSSNVNNACVCTQWSEVALDNLWRTVDNICRLFTILSPVYAHSHRYEFARQLEPDDWARFERYASRVRSLRFRHGTEGRMMQKLFDAVARTRTSLVLLPNLHALEWVTTGHGIDWAVLFMHKSVKHLIISIIPSDSSTPTLPLVKDIVSRMPLITELDLRTQVPIRSVQDQVCYLFRSLPKLKKIVVPNYHITSAVVEELSKLENLGVIQFEYGCEQGVGDINDIRVFSPSLAEDAFPSLWDISLTASLSDATRFLNQKFSPADLTSLYVGATGMETPSALHTILTTVSETCQLLETLILDLLQELSPGPPTYDTQISIDTLRPLLACPKLTTFELTHEYPLRLTHDNIEELARSWPTLQRLLLNCEPVWLDADRLSLRALLPFAQHCPQLKSLGLFLHASALDAPPLAGAAPFARLEKLSFGVSSIAEEGPLALLLAQLCPPGCAIEFGVTWEDVMQGHQPDLLAEVAVRCEKWEEVARLLPLLTQLRLQENARAQSLQTEVEDLRTRNRILMDKAGMKGDTTVAGCSIM